MRRDFLEKPQQDDTEFTESGPRVHGANHLNNPEWLHSPHSAGDRKIFPPFDAFLSDLGFDLFALCAQLLILG